jgi:hypothetical protein
LSESTKASTTRTVALDEVIEAFGQQRGPPPIRPRNEALHRFPRRAAAQKNNLCDAHHIPLANPVPVSQNHTTACAGELSGLEQEEINA